MSFQVIVFYSFAAWLIFAALMVISSKHSVKAALFLVLAFASASGIWMLLEAEFLAVSLIVVYVGAVMVLLLFVVMMLDVDYAALRQGFVKKLPLALIIALGFFAILYSFITHGDFSGEAYASPAPKPEDYSNIKELGRVLYTDYVLAFEIAAVILLVAIIAAIALTFRGRRSRKAQVISKQLAANKKNRLKVLKMDAVKTAPKSESNEEAEE
ncbi:NADH-quinone oxidoreductase subunit J [Aliikangiella coralliicola]|uniref:NADH-quinone oxidoreductase subunit J n=1 Tax=Aliikangiella coralliicola TaxID=2592383 RepID=A0A545UEE1_9GAMM|nr:NADH-quinone oxidoreductase subunit J [Aliikangiella coralliicola]TQV87828.1 NADH-quinone oxidoreductase subunit J [Aliikangiella coralliicola]